MEDTPPNKKQKTSDSHSEDETNTLQRTKADPLQNLGVHWREGCRGVRAINRYALKNYILTDVTFTVGIESTVFQAHRLILALGSPVFEAMFYGALAETGDSISIPDVDPEGFKNLLRFLYSDDIFFKSDVDAFKTYFAAEKYCVTPLKEKCDGFLLECELTPSNIWVFLESSLYLNSQAIRERCLCFLKYITEDALQHDSFLDVSATTIETLLCLDSLNVTEMKLLQHVVRWAESKSNMEQGDSLQNILMPLLKFIRFGTLTTAQFIDIIEMPELKDLLTDRDALDILKHINQPMSCALPEWCCTKTWRDHNVKMVNRPSCSTDKFKSRGKKHSKSKFKEPYLKFLRSPSPFSTDSHSSLSSTSSASLQVKSDSSDDELTFLFQK